MVTYPSTHGSSRTPSPTCARWSTTPAVRSTSTVPTSTPSSGLARPGKFGADVSHLNLHKTFCIPHGGGGPGVGPVGGARPPGAAPAQPPARRLAGPTDGVGPGVGGALRLGEHPADLVGVRAPHGRGGVDVAPPRWPSSTPTTSRPGCVSTTRCSTGQDGLVAHECILDLRGITKDTGVTVDDVAKRLIDYGFHAPTMSFPVAGTLMVEPTESEDLGRARPLLRRDDRDPRRDRRGRVGAVERRRQRAAGAPAHGRPSPATGTTGTTAGRPPSRRGSTRRRSTGPGGRIDGAYGDRHLVCSCPPPRGLRGVGIRRRLGSSQAAGWSLRVPTRTSTVLPDACLWTTAWWVMRLRRSAT
jgi:glycine dehydrogenase